MAKPSFELIEAFRETARRLRNGAHYAWGHHGACNCGNLLQVLTPFTEGEILRYAHTGTGEWTELAEEYCTATKAPVNMVISKLEQAGLSPADIHHIEYLTDRAVLDNLPGGFRWLKKNSRENVIEYFEAFADLMEDRIEMKSDNYRIENRKVNPENYRDGNKGEIQKPVFV
jgi:hypothetical protein